VTASCSLPTAFSQLRHFRKTVHYARNTMPIRLLIACGMLAVACPVSAQVHYFGHGVLVYDSHVAPYYGSHQYDGYRGHAHAHQYSHGYRSSHAPLANQYDVSQYDAGSSHQAFGHGDFERGHGAPISNCDSCPGAFVCPLQNGYGYADSPQQYDQHGGGQFGSSQSRDGHIHEEGHAHDHAHEGLGSSLAPRGDVGRLQPLPRNQVPFRDQVAPRMQTLPPSDSQRVAPPALPPSSLSRPEQFETPLGDGPPPNTVPLSSPRQSLDRNAGPTALNI
jgi:hypothetical protein